ncbi:MAG: aminoglycoside phosphotransferase family protein [Candidatus Entotheonellia bacterium]
MECLRTHIQQLFPDQTPAIRVIPLLGDASDRRYYRLLLTPPAHGIPSLVLMRLAKPYPPGDLPFLNVQRYFALKGIPVPQVFSDDPTHGIILLEDLGDRTLEAAVREASSEEIRQWYHRALDIVITLQQPEAPLPREHCVAFRLAFDVDKLMWELDFFITHMLKRLCGRQLPAAAEAVMRGQFWKVSAELARQPRVLTHRDYHSRNLMVQQGALRVIDFQDARLGPCQYDLASLLYDSYVVLPDELRGQLLTYYVDRKSDAKERYPDHEEFARLFDYMCLQRNLKALGTFAFQVAMKGNRRYIAAMQPTMGYVRENLVRHPELRGLGEILEKYLFEAFPAISASEPGKVP